MIRFLPLLAILMGPLALAEEPQEASTEPAPPAAASQLDRLDLDTTSITGSQELPKVLYIVPWKQAGIGDLTGKPVNSLLDEVLMPLDRDVFRRQVRYFDQLYVNSEVESGEE